MSNGDSIALEWLGSIISSLLVLSFALLILLIALGYATTAGISQAVFVLYGFVITLAMIQVVGTDVVKAWSEYVGKK